ncbi:MAG TPA: hypothetical protein VNO33_07615, partial [Kofleriaceae bacterium]|nr:hypothetical protein [Kofleriaceae bacterium]
MLRSILSSPLGGAMSAALLIAVLELVALGSGAFDLVVTVISLHAALGLVIGLLLWLTESAAER